MAKLRRSRRIFAVTAFSLAGYSMWRLRGVPVPREELDFDADFETRCETFRTEDGVDLRLKRYVNEGAQPIILAHGYTGNGLEFDLPHRRHNLALYLAERGYDVWISSFRGCGRPPYNSETRDWNHSIDHLAALDAPALINGVSEVTGKRPLWIGHSMGGMVLYMYLLGAKIETGGGGFKVTLDSELAAERNRSLLGGITIGSPPAFHHGGAAWVATLSRLPFFKANTRLLMRYFHLLNRISPKLSVGRLGDLVTRFPRLGRVLAVRGPVAVALYNVDNVYPNVGYSLLKWASDNVTTRMTNQILALALDPDLKDYNGECNYTKHMENITLPLFFITGSVDFVGPENIREYGHQRVGSSRKRFENFPGYGHTDLVMGKRVAEEVYPAILEWIEELSG